MTKRDLIKNPFTKKDLDILERFLKKENENKKYHKSKGHFEVVESIDKLIKSIKENIEKVKKAIK